MSRRRTASEDQGMKRKLPVQNRDLKGYVLRRRLFQIVGYLLWIAAFAMGAWSYNDAHQTYPPHRRIIGWKLAIWLAVAAVAGFFLLRLWRFFTLRSVEGVVVENRLSHSYTHSADPGAQNSVSYDFRLNTYLVIRDESGKRRRLRFEQKPGFYLYYYPGTRVCRFAGLPYPVRDPNSVTEAPRRKRGEGSHDDLSEGFLCVACGFLNNPSADTPCGCCGHSLVDPKAVWDERES